MPLFDYICLSCGAEFEALVMGSSRPYCPKCQSDNLKKKMSSFAFRSGGSGGSDASSNSSGAGSSCSGCAGGSCSSCH